jgi:hypothetical protein
VHASVIYMYTVDGTVRRKFRQFFRHSFIYINVAIVRVYERIIARLFYAFI